MKNSYSHVNTVHQNLYTAGAPVILTSASLWKEEETGQTAAKLAFRSISDQKILSMRILLQPLDGEGASLGAALAYFYPDVNVQRGGEFGQETLLMLNDDQAQSFSVTVEEVTFGDDTCWKGGAALWEPLCSPIPVASIFTDKEMQKQYRMAFGEQSIYMYREAKDLWYCACGAVNRREEKFCSKCGLEAAAIKNANWKKLRDAKDARVTLEQAEEEEAEAAAEQKAAEEREARLAAEKAEAQRLAAEKAEAERIAAEKAIRKKIRAEKARKAARVLIVLLMISGALISFLRWQKKQQETYDYALVLLEEDRYDEAKEVFLSLGKFKDSDWQAENVEAVRLADTYAYAWSLKDAGEYIQAAEVFRELGNYEDSAMQVRDCVYRQGLVLMDELRYAPALEIFQELGGYRDSSALAEQLLSCNPLLFLEIGETVTMGTYEQDNDRRNGKEAIEWMVLAKEPERMLLISRYALEAREFHTGWKGSTWEGSSSRRWLNGTFYSGAFVYDEKRQILQTELTTPQNPKYETDSGRNTKDRIFLLSLEEFETYFTPGLSRQVIFTPYAQAEHERKDSWGINGEGWWLRTIGSEAFRPVYVWEDGKVINQMDNYACNAILALRPAMWIDVSSADK